MSKNSQISKRASAVKPFLAMDMMAEAGKLERAGKDVVHMEVGQPSGGPAAKVREAALAALASENLGYMDALGMVSLRQRIARHYRNTYGLEISPDRVVVTTGSSAAFVLAFLAAFDAGQKIGLVRPGYPAYRNIVSATDLEVVDIATNAQSRWAPTPQDVADGGFDGLLLASPANPTGTMMKPDSLEELVKACSSAGVRFISDEIYHGLTFGVPQTCALQFDDEVIVINSFSKYYCMTGWRVGWMIVPDRLVRAVECLSQNLYISAPALSQHAALAAFDATDELEQRKQAYAKNRDFLMNALPQIGIDKFTPVDGAFYIYADISKFTNDSHDFTTRMVRQAGVAATTGLDFDPVDGHRHMRLSFAGSFADMQRAVKRMGDWLD